MSALLLPTAIMLAAGACLAIQAPTNAALAGKSGSVLFASFASFAIGTAVLLVLWLSIDGGRLHPPEVGELWIWTGGFLGAIYVAAMAFSAPRLGLASAITLAIGSQIVVALLIDHFAILGIDHNPISLRRMAGGTLVLIGVLLVRR